MTVVGETPLEWLLGQLSALLILVAITAVVAIVGIPIAIYKQRRADRKAAPTIVWAPTAPPPVPPTREAVSVTESPAAPEPRRTLSGWQRVFLILGLVYIVAAALVALSGGKTEPGLYKGVSGDWCADRDGMFIDLRGTAGGYWDIYGKWHATNTTTNCFIGK